MNNTQETYIELMKTIRNRFDLVSSLKLSPDMEKFLTAEICAFNGRKIVEGIAFCCLVALENGIKHIPRDAKGHWNAQVILESLEKKKFDKVFPSPSIIRSATKKEYNQFNIEITIEGQPDKRITPEELINIYSRFHRWAHELNPYTEKGGRKDFLEKHEKALWKDIETLWHFIEKHTISINGEMFFCILRDNKDGLVKIISLTKKSDL